MLQAVYGVFYAAVVSACDMHPGEAGRPFQAAAAEMAGGCVVKGPGAEAAMSRSQGVNAGHACVTEVRAFGRIVQALTAQQTGRREEKIDARLEPLTETLPHESPSMVQYIAIDNRANAREKPQKNQSRRIKKRFYKQNKSWPPRHQDTEPIFKFSSISNVVR
jgi:hypothetical protein